MQWGFLGMCIHVSVRLRRWDIYGSLSCVLATQAASGRVYEVEIHQYAGGFHSCLIMIGRTGEVIGRQLDLECI